MNEHLSTKHEHSHGLAEFDQNAVAGLRMQKGDQFIIGTAFWLAVQGDKSFGLQSVNFGPDIGYFEGDVVDAFSAFFDKSGDGALRVGSFEEFDFAFTDMEERSRHLFTFDGLDFVVCLTEQAGKEVVTIRHIADGYTYMIYFDHRTSLIGSLTST